MELGIATVAGLAGWLYLVVFAVAALDAIIPVMPSESVVITGALLASQGEVSLPGIFLAGALGAIAGDVTSYALGRLVSRRRGGVPPIGRAGRWLEHARGLLASHGPGTLIVARFVPGGRTATTFTSGFVGMGATSFLSSVVAGAVLWAGQAAAIGYLGGTVFEDHLLLGLGLGLLCGVGVGLAVEAARSAWSTRPATASAPPGMVAATTA